MSPPTVRRCTSLAALALLASCDLSAPPTPGPSFPPKHKTLVTKFSADDALPGTISGRVRLEGAPPPARKIAMGSDPNCHALAGPSAEESSVNLDGTLRDAVLVLDGAPLLGRPFPVPAAAAVLDQRGCRYHPRTLSLMAGQGLEIVNSDATLHNVHAMPKASKEFNLGMPTAGMRVTKSFPVPERMVAIKCDVHPWMRAHVAVVAHPFHATTGDAGTFTIADVPPGDYVLEAWHPDLAGTTVPVTVGSGKTASVEVTMRLP